MGRPKSLSPVKDHRLQLRLSADELDSIDYVARFLGVSRSAAIIQTMVERADQIYKTTEWKPQK